MKRVLVTGGAGFIGFHLSARLADEGWDVVSIDCLNPKVHLDAATSRKRLHGSLIEGDILDDATWRSVPRVDAIVHLAAETGVGQSMYEQDLYRRVNVDGTARVAAFAKQTDTPLVFFSSRAVYGEGAWACDAHGACVGQRCCVRATPVASREDDGYAPVSIYGETKVAGEALLLGGAAGDAPVTIIRPQNVIGAGQALHNPYTGVLAAFLARLREGRPVQIYGDGHQTRDFIHVRDVSNTVVFALKNVPSEPLIVNCGSGVRTSLCELAAYAIGGAPVAGTVTHVEVTRAGDIEHACADLTRSVEIGAPSACISAADAVRDFIESSWNETGVTSALWDDALAELEGKGLTS